MSSLISSLTHHAKQSLSLNNGFRDGGPSYNPPQNPDLQIKLVDPQHGYGSRPQTRSYSDRPTIIDCTGKVAPQHELPFGLDEDELKKKGKKLAKSAGKKAFDIMKNGLK